MTVETKIQSLLNETEDRYGVKILYACESGSRAWGFASPDSDYDIRFIFAHPESEYLKVLQPLDNIEIAIKDDLDPGGWDVKKALSLLRKSNGALSEWLHSPIVYREEEGFLDKWRRGYAEVFSPKALHDHYRGLARQMWKGALSGEAVRAKSYLYCLRATLAAKYVVGENKPAPVPFADLLGYLPDRLAEVIDNLLEYKSGSGEKETMARIVELDDFLASEIEAKSPDGLRKPPKTSEALDMVFRQSIVDKPLVKQSCFTLQKVREAGSLFFETIAGSKAYWTNTANSDEDLRGIFLAPQSYLLSGGEIEQVQDEKGDEVYYELGKFFELLMKSNPNALEMLFMPDDCIKYKHPLMELIEPSLFLTKRCELSFGNYALGQVKKAKGLNKKMMNPEPEERKGLADFCFVLEDQGSKPLLSWLSQRGIIEEHCAIVAVTHAPGVYAVFYDADRSSGYRGIFSKSSEDSLIFTSVAKGAEPIAWMSCNENAFKKHCKHHNEYWHWVKHRNEERYLVNSEHDRGYDSKNIMHTMRLLEIAETIATEGTIHLRSPNRDFLMKVRNGEYAYEDLLQQAEERMERIKIAYSQSSLPEDVDRERAMQILWEIRAAFR